VARPQVELPAADARRSGPHAKLDVRVLVVDDEQSIADFVAEVLTDLGYNVVCKADGASAMDYYRRAWRRVDAVILDVNMPNMSGAETFAAMQKVNPGAKVLVSSGYSSEGAVTDLLTQGAAGFVAKPFRADDIAREIEKVLRPKSNPSQARQ
jgi:two-component system cell cycle sensor histidine kinase/response regulator CckA